MKRREFFMPKYRRTRAVLIFTVALLCILTPTIIFPMIGMEIACRVYDRPAPARPSYKFLTGGELRKLTNGDLFIERNNMGGVTSYDGGDRSGWKSYGVSGPAVPSFGSAFVGHNIICLTGRSLRPFSGLPHFTIQRIAKDTTGKLFSIEVFKGREYSYPLGIMTVEEYRKRPKYSQKSPSPRT